MSADGETIGTIEIEGAPIQTPTGGKIIGYRNKEELDDGIFYVVGQTIGTGDAVIDSPITKLSPRARSSRLPRRSNPRRSQARPSPRFQVRGHEDDQDRCSCSHGSKDRRQTRSSRRRLERSHRGSRPCGNSRHRRGRRGEPQALVNTFSHGTVDRGPCLLVYFFVA
ncbi:MAG: hypothetical protein ACLU0O_06480 [Collinsella sp.]